MASWASWAFLTFDVYCPGWGDRNLAPYSLVMVARTAGMASADSVTASVRMYVM